MRRWSTLLKREFWEHQSAVFWVPLGCLVVMLALFAAKFIVASPINPSLGKANDLLGLSISLGGLAFVLYLLLPFVTFNYGLHNLYEERSSKSILFWRSMPVSDTQTVVSKAIFATLITPTLFVLLFTVAFVIIVLAQQIISYSPLEAKQLLGYFLAVVSSFYLITLLTLPYYAYANFISAISHRSPWLIAMLPFVVIFVVSWFFPSLSIVNGLVWVPAKLATLITSQVALGITEQFDTFTVAEDWLSKFQYIDMNVKSLKQLLAEHIDVLAICAVISVIFLTLAVIARKRTYSL